MKWNKDQYRITTDKSDLQIDVIHAFLKDSYWCPNIPRAIVEKAAEGSLCFGLYNKDKEQIGYARLVTDYVTFAYVMDVFVLEAYRGRGLGKWLMQCVMEYPGISGFRKIMLGTVDAHGLYKKSGFKPLARPELVMEINVPDVYLKNTV